MGQEPRRRGPVALGTRGILWLSFLTAVVAYGVVGYAVFGRAPARSPVPAWLWPILAGIFAVLAIVLPGRLGDRIPASSEDATLLRPRELVSWAFAEAVAIVGLIAVALGTPRGPFAAYLALAAIILWLRRPSD